MLLTQKCLCAVGEKVIKVLCYHLRRILSATFESVSTIEVVMSKSLGVFYTWKFSSSKTGLEVH